MSSFLLYITILWWCISSQPLHLLTKHISSYAREKGIRYHAVRKVVLIFSYYGIENQKYWIGTLSMVLNIKMCCIQQVFYFSIVFVILEWDIVKTNYWNGMISKAYLIIICIFQLFVRMCIIYGIFQISFHTFLVISRPLPPCHKS